MAKCLYKTKDLDVKVDKLAKLFPTIDWADIYELFPQIMETVECIGIVYNSTLEDKKYTCVTMIEKLLTKVKAVDGIKESLPGLFDIIDNASKGRYAINRKQLY